jgi:hypothetical protein
MRTLQIGRGQAQDLTCGAPAGSAEASVRLVAGRDVDASVPLSVRADASYRAVRVIRDRLAPVAFGRFGFVLAIRGCCCVLAWSVDTREKSQPVAPMRSVLAGG